MSPVTITPQAWPLAGHAPWGSVQTGDVRYEQPAARQLARYVCQRGHEFEIPFAVRDPAGETVQPPDNWPCPCGSSAGQTVPGAETYREHCMRQLRMRRSNAQLELILAERLAQIRGASTSSS